MSGSTCFVIAGAGGLGREVAVYAREAGLSVRGFLDDTDAAPAGYGLDIPVVSTIDDYRPRPHDAVLVAVGAPAARAAIAGRLTARGAHFGLLVHPLAYVAQPSELAPGCIVAPFATIGLNARLGPHCLINTHAGIGHDCRLGQCVVISPHGVVNGFAHVQDHVMVGSSAVVTPGLNVGAGAQISAGSVVLSDVAAGRTVWGNPARALPPAPKTA
ncbi:NeuD/PglB/VioB family sugar acetyltransferase [Magnetospirillum sulfuroxidans]|uniref:NeuD/PglB/VioB family sugar acetyltransferase n=1 Tax=Magnetospirillum sulfuroxidans TaxID=611300 RepID=A0ABS5ICF2_9PROT|nr:NeuD/PglB/VioB family sugar acetyltransferase [Magnetospirillum sulfuroxidans]MBR9971358.1 NeuD/PglB/VioB family sugar acetyltransferase [Magnetospirillum sulfuroxidans]